MADYFDRLELELRAAVPRATAYPHPHALPYPHANRIPPRRWRPRPGNLFVAVSVAVTAAVVVLAVALVGHAHKPAHASSPLVQRPPAATQPQYKQHRVSKVLTGDGIGRVRFGQSRVAVISAVTRLLGPSSTGYKRANAVLAECGVDHTMIWPNWPMVSAYGSHYPLDTVLTVWFSHSRFVGYQYGEFRNMPAPRAPSLGTVLATTRGLTIGDTFARGRRLYGAAFRTSTAQGGVFLISAPAGRIDGFAWQPPNYRGVSLRSLVATIDAGDVGCPALSP